jgi:hypothetical protein
VNFESLRHAHLDESCYFSPVPRELAVTCWQDWSRRVNMLQDMFDDIRAAGQWDVESPLLWGYFFTHPTQAPLRELASLLRARGYRYVDIFAPDAEVGAAEYYYLHVEKCEVHTVDSLHARNTDLYALAQYAGVATYDGMDVGPILQPGNSN